MEANIVSFDIKKRKECKSHIHWISKVDSIPSSAIIINNLLKVRSPQSDTSSIIDAYNDKSIINFDNSKLNKNLFVQVYD